MKWEEIFWAFRVPEVKFLFIFCVDNVWRLAVGAGLGWTLSSSGWIISTNNEQLCWKEQKKKKKKGSLVKYQKVQECKKTKHEDRSQLHFPRRIVVRKWITELIKWRQHQFVWTVYVWLTSGFYCPYEICFFSAKKAEVALHVIDAQQNVWLCTGDHCSLSVS